MFTKFTEQRRILIQPFSWENIICFYGKYEEACFPIRILERAGFTNKIRLVYHNSGDFLRR